MRLQQSLDDEQERLADVYGISGNETWQPHFAHSLADYDKVWVILDNDQDYNVRARNDACWKQIRSDVGKRARRVILPNGVKDLCEFFNHYNLDTLRELCSRTSPLKSRFTRLDLQKAPPPMDWLVDNLICAGDVNIIVGDPGLGKSWLMMDLAIRVAEGAGKWLGRDVLKQGPVLYVDEENPEDIIYHRFKKLGLPEKAARSIHFLYRPGIWLNKEPEPLVDEAIELEPALVVLDSLSRLHSEDENNANAMASLFREGIVPLARETGAAVIVIHHTTKGESENSFKRARGSGDISAVVDAALDIRGTEIPGKFTISQYKSRRRLGGEIITCKIEDTAEGGVRLVASSPDDFPF